LHPLADFEEKMNRKYQILSPVTEGQAIRGYHAMLTEYERRYILAIKTSDMQGAELILAAFLKLIWSAAASYGSARRISANPAMLEWEEFNNAVNEAMSRAHTLSTHVRYMSKSEFYTMRQMPTPTGFRNLTLTFSSRVTRITNSPARRMRR
jgi:hypothetical protein